MRAEQSVDLPVAYLAVLWGDRRAAARAVMSAARLDVILVVLMVGRSAVKWALLKADPTVECWVALWVARSVAVTAGYSVDSKAVEKAAQLDI